jgi:hypothetical protein
MSETVGFQRQPSIFMRQHDHPTSRGPWFDCAIVISHQIFQPNAYNILHPLLPNPSAMYLDLWIHRAPAKFITPRGPGQTVSRTELNQVLRDSPLFPAVHVTGYFLLSKPRNHRQIEHIGWVISISISYPVGPGFISWSEGYDWGSSCILFSIHRKISGRYIKIRHDFLPYCLQFITRNNFPIWPHSNIFRRESVLT